MIISVEFTDHSYTLCTIISQLKRTGANAQLRCRNCNANDHHFSISHGAYSEY